MKPFLVCLLIMAFAAPMRADDPPVAPVTFPDLAPTAFKYHYEHELSFSTTVELKGIKLEYSTTIGGQFKNTTITPSPEAWARFIEELNAAKIYKWSLH